MLKSRVTCFTAGALLALFLVCWAAGGPKQIAVRSLQLDFPQYWAASHLLLNRQNPYDVSQQESVVREFFPQSKPVYFWAAPPALIQVLPLALATPETAALIWQLVGLFAFAASAFLFATSFAGKSFQVPQAWLFALGMLAVLGIPFFDALRMGQISPLLCLGVAIVFSGVASESAWTIAVGVLLTASKPHHVVVLYLFLFLRSAVTRRGMARALLLLVFLAIAFELFSANIFFSWFNSVWTSQELASGVYHPQRYHTASLADAINNHVLAASGYAAAQVRMGVMAVGILLYVLMRRSLRRLTATDEAAIACALSFLVSPYLWTFDMPALPLILASVAITRVSVWQRTLAAFILCGIFSLLFLADSYDDGWWVAPSVVSALMIFQLLLKKVPQPN